MDLSGKTVVVTGAGGGIGQGLAERFARESAQVVCSDVNLAQADKVAQRIGGHAVPCDVSDEDQIKDMIRHVEQKIAPIDLFCANAGILTLGGVDVSNEDWDRIWKTNVMSHVWMARHLVPRMVARGAGYLLITASAAGVLNQPGAAPYGVTKHAAVAMAEWLAFTYGNKGIRVSVLCPQAVQTDMLDGHEDSVAAIDGILDVDSVASACVQAINAEQFLILPHPQVLDYMRLKAADFDRWLAGMSALNQKFIEDT